MKARRIIDRLVQVVPPLVYRNHKRKDTCIISTAITLDVLAHFGVKARPLVVEFSAMNAYAYQCALRREIPDPLPDEYWTVGLQSQEGFFGHMVAVALGDTIVDLTIGQAARPDQGIDLPPGFAFRCHSSPIESICQFESPAGFAVEYVPRPDDRRYLLSNWWHLPSLRRGIVREAIVKISGKRLV